MNFEDCKNVMNSYLIGHMTKEEITTWAIEHCNNCKEKICHCNDCPMYINGSCKFPI